MDSPRSDTSALADLLEFVECLGEAARRGDWTTAGEMAARLAQKTLPVERDELGEYLQCLKDALIAGRASRAHMAATLVRVNAAAGFNNTQADFVPQRQDFGGTADS